MLQRIAHFLTGTLRGRLIVSVAVVHAVLMALFIVDLTIRQRSLLLDRQTDEAIALSQALATSAAGWIAADDIAGMQELVEAQRRYPELVFAMLTDDQGRIMADTDKPRRGLFLLDLHRDARQAVFSRTAALVDVATPAMIGGRHVGWARVGIGQKVAGQKLAEITKSGILYALVAIVAGSFIAWLMGRRITRRLYAVQETINMVRAGNRQARSTLTGMDEAAVMAGEFNAMLDAVDERDEELRASETKFRSLIQQVQTAIVLHDGQGRILDSNPLAQELLSLSADQLSGKELIDPAWRFLREDGSPLPVDDYPVSVVLATRQPVRGYITGITSPKIDRVTWVMVNAEPVYNDSGDISQVIISFIDITERKGVEETLHRLNRELRAISNCNLTLMKATNEQSLLEDICRIICDEAGYRMAWVGYRENDENRVIRPVAWAGFEEGYLTEATVTWSDTVQGQGPSARAIRTGNSSCIQDFATDPGAAPWRDAALQRGFRSCIALPLKSEHAEVFGALNIYSSTPGAFDQDEIRLLEELTGDLAFGIAILRDRVARREAERSITLMGIALDNVSEATYLIDDQAHFRYVNEGACRILGYSRNELLGMSVMDVDPDFTPERWPEHWNELAQRRSLIFERHHRAKDGRISLVEINANYLEYDGQGYNLALVHDITERKQTEETLKNAARSLNEAQRLAHIGNWELDLTTNTLIWSEEIYRIFEIDPEKFGATYEAFLAAVHPDDREAVNYAYTNSLKTRTPYTIDHRLLFPDGRIKHVHEQCETFFINDIPMRSIGTVQDITERKQVEQTLVELNEELDRRVQERTAELEAKNALLERLNKIFVGRELRMVELKEMIRELEKKCRDVEDNQ